MVAIFFAIFPIAVSSPTATTTASPLPETTCVPINTMFFCSDSGTFFAVSTCSVFCTEPDSPVSDASSAWRLLTDTKRASAGTFSPSSSTTRSPCTTLLSAISISLPSRNTVAVVSTNFLSAMSVFCARPSCTVPTAALNKRSAAMIALSTGSPAKNTMALAPKRRYISGLLNCSRNMVRYEALPASCSIFGPYFANRAAASCAERPCSLVCNCLRTAEAVCVCQRLSIASFTLLIVHQDARPKKSDNELFNMFIFPLYFMYYFVDSNQFALGSHHTPQTDTHQYCEHYVKRHIEPSPVASKCPLVCQY